MISGTTEINTDPTVGDGCSRAIDPGKFLGSSPVLDDTKPQVTVLTPQIAMAPVVAQPSETNMVTDCDLDPGCPYDL